MFLLIYRQHGKFKVLQETFNTFAEAQAKADEIRAWAPQIFTLVRNEGCGICNNKPSMAAGEFWHCPHCGAM